ncbi:Non-specific lipid-transfer protein-like protein [Camellia lanceoleosa]|uniref:Non-specific lipid-transfer protein-like protein n=1 Tax=Camellia lanceoleosa TaxID=1840588 RepID=A0ACC0IR01_9ERIC|nr:Non-specific lipid-transfer protein-like protein [Camellia lanceoleosa]
MSTKTATTTLLFSILCIGFFSVAHSAHSHSHAAAPAPAVDCSTLIVSMADCLSYVTNGSTVKKPGGTCCSGLKTVLKSNAECLCEAFKNSAQLGITLNITKALALPTACHLSAPSVSNCRSSLVAGTAPAISPALSPSAGTNELAPAPVAGVSGSGSAALAVSIGSLVVALVAASFSFM